MGDLIMYNELVTNSEINKRGVMYTFGGLIGEIILVFTAI
jgi:hypothetical protein